MKAPWKQRLVETQAKRSSVAKELLDHSRIFLKLDLAYLVAAGAIFTGLKLEIDDVLINFGTYWFVPWFFVALVSVDALAYQGLYNAWTRHLAPTPAAQPGGRALFVLTQMQVPLHLFFFTTLVVYLTGFAQGSFDAMREYEAKARIQRSIDLSIAETGKVPEDIAALAQTSYLRKALEKIRRGDVRIKATGGTSYTLTFAGKDHEFGTPDDDEYSNQISAAKIYDQLYGDKKHSKDASKDGR
ncbi:hypothetical protein [Variovorax sp. 350MFTsu5.1]|uniref:hypothetical protein n=1 Tax=Variovorax sp. 350MFTsu5.1 TaxID=3158365 RepID=UPI003AAE3076